MKNNINIHLKAPDKQMQRFLLTTYNIAEFKMLRQSNAT